MAKEICETSIETFYSKKGVISLPTGVTLSNKQRSFLDLALRVAETSDVNHRHGAVVVKAGKPVSLGVNKWRNRDMVQRQKEYSPDLTTHAEIDALSRVSDPRGAVVYVARVGKQGEPKFSRPCDNCAKALNAMGVKTVIYTTAE